MEVVARGQERDRVVEVGSRGLNERDLGDGAYKAAFG